MNRSMAQPFFGTGKIANSSWEAKETTISNEYQTFDRIVDAASYVTCQRQVDSARSHFAPEAGFPSNTTSLKRSTDQASLLPSSPPPSSPKKRPPPEIPSLALSNYISNDITTITKYFDADLDMLYSNLADADAADGSTTDGLETHLERLKEYTNVAASVTVADCFEERFMGLYGFLVDWLFNAKSISKCLRKRRKRRKRKASEASASLAHILQLIDLGMEPKFIRDDAGSETASQVTLSKISRGKPSQAAERNLLKEYEYNIYGTKVLFSESCQGKFEPSGGY